MNPALFSNTLGSISIHPLCRKLIETPDFQRLKDIKQLDQLNLMFDNATHTRQECKPVFRSRFEHCIGTSYLCGKYYDELIKHSKRVNNMNDEEIEKYRLCVVVAGLLHDIGHCVLGHSYPKYVKNCTKLEPTEHETMGILIIKRLLKRNDIWNAFCENGLNEEADANENNPLSYIDYIYMMIAGKKKLLPKEMDSLWDAVPNNRKWLLLIVSNEK